MSKLNQIQRAIKELDGGAFQKLADAFLKKKGYDKINSIGSVLGENKVKVGTPDTLVLLPNDKYIFVEHTTISVDVFAKFCEDIDKCFSEAKTGIPISKISEIVLCHTSILSSTNIEKLRNKCYANRVELTIFDVSAMSHDIYDQYPNLAKDHLGLDIDSGQLLDVKDFVDTINRNKHSTRLDTKLHFRETELDEISKALFNHDLVILSGKAGVGKTRLAIESLARFKKRNPEYIDLCVFNIANLDLFNDLKSRLSECKRFILLVDDANRISKFDYIIHFLLNQKNGQRIKVIATVRDYALSSIYEVSHQLGLPQVISINSLNDEQIKKIVQDEYAISNTLYLDRISELSKGNPRLAVMMAEIAVRENTLESISDVTNVYDHYFSTVGSDLLLQESGNLLEIAAMVAFLRAIDISNSHLEETIKSVLEIELDIFWEGVLELHKKEIIDVYENQVAKFSDQILATYLIYLAVFKTKLIPFKLLFSKFFYKNRQLFNDAIFPVLNAFNIEKNIEAIKPVFYDSWENANNASDKRHLYALIEDYWFIDKTKVLHFIAAEIKQVVKVVNTEDIDFSEKEESVEDPILSILRNFKNSTIDEFSISLDLIFDYVDQAPSKYKQFLYLIKHNYSFTHRSWHTNYFLQSMLIDRFSSRVNKDITNVFSHIFLSIASTYLKTDCEHTEGNRSTMTMYRFKLTECQAIRAIRTKVLELLSILFDVEKFRPQVLAVLGQYIQENLRVASKEIIQGDSLQIIEFFKNKLNPQVFEHSLIVDSYFRKLEIFEIPYDVKIRREYQSKSLKFYRLLTIDYSEKKAMAVGVNEYESYKTEKIKAFANRLQFSEVGITIQYLSDLDKGLNSRSLWEVRNGFGTFISELIKRGEKWAKAAIYGCLKYGEFLELNPYFFMGQASNLYGSEYCFNLLSECNSPSKNKWLFCYFSQLDFDSITDEKHTQLITQFKNITSPKEFFFDWEYLLKYEKFKVGTILNVTKILLGKCRSDEIWRSTLIGLFQIQNASDYLERVFNSDVDVLKAAYLNCCSVSQGLDYAGGAFNQILNLDHNFIIEYIEWLHAENFGRRGGADDRSYSFLFERPDYIEIISIALAAIYDISKKTYTSFSMTIFGVDYHQNIQSFNEKQTAYLMHIISEKNSDHDYMAFIFDLINQLKNDSEKIPFIKKLIDLNSDINVFRAISILNSSSWSGSRVPILEGNIDFLKQVSALFNTADLLSHKLHVEKQIELIRKDVKREKMRDFLDI